MKSTALRTGLALALALVAGACATGPSPTAPVTVRVLAFNDFHGNLETPSGGWMVPDGRGGAKRVSAGGVAHLATALKSLRAQAPHSVTVSAGDLVSASPLASALFFDEPTVDAMAAAGLDFSTVGNHEFDRGRSELLRLVRGGCHPKEGCLAGPYGGARFGYLAANVIDTATGRTLFPPYAIRTFDGVPVAFVGAALSSTPTVVDKRGLAGLAFKDEAESVNALVPELRRQGVEAIVLLVHDGGELPGGVDDPACPGFQGAILDIVRRLDRAVDVVVSGHTHEAYRCRVDGRLVTSAGSYGRLVTAIDLALDRGTRDVVSAQARNVVVETDRYPADPALEAHVARFAKLAVHRAGRIVGTVRGEFTTAQSPAGESTLGSLVAQSQLAAMRDLAGARAAFMNPGGLRAPLASRRPDGSITYGDLFAVQPFGNAMMAVTLTGEQVLRALERQWRAPPDIPRVLQVAGIAYAWDGTKPLGSRVVPGSVRIDGRPLDPKADYRVAVNSFLHGGGDGFTVFGEGRDPAGGPLDVEAFEAFVRGATLVAGKPAELVRRVDVAR